MHGIIQNQEYIKHEKESGKLRFIKGGAWSLNVQEYAGKPVRRFVYITEKARYSVPMETVVSSKCFNRDFQGEKKRIVPLSLWQVEQLN